MIEKRSATCNSMVNIFFWGTLCGIVFLILSYPIGMACLTLGANSMYVALCYAGFEENLLIVRFCGRWLVGFPILLILAYILVKKKQWYIPFLTLVIADSLFVCISGAFELARDNVHGFVMILLDIIVSVVFCFIFTAFVYSFRKELKRNESSEQTEGLSNDRADVGEDKLTSE